MRWKSLVVVFIGLLMLGAMTGTLSSALAKPVNPVPNVIYDRSSPRGMMGDS